MKESKRILVAGIAGFLSSHLYNLLVFQDHEVLCADNFYTGSRKNIEHLLSKPNFEILRHDVTFPLYVEVDQIYKFCLHSKLYNTLFKRHEQVYVARSICFA